MSEARRGSSAQGGAGGSSNSRLLSVLEEYMFANSLIYLVDDGWELNRDSVRVLLRNYLSQLGRRRSGDKSLSDKAFWSDWISAFEQKWSALTGKISKLPGQPTDEFLQLAKDVLASSLNKMAEGQREEGRASTAAGAAAGKSSAETLPGTAHCRRAGNVGGAEALYEVQRILAKRYNLSRKVDEYLIKWKLFDYGGNTWEPRDNLDCPAMLAQFERRWSALSAGEKQQLIDDRGNGRVYDKLLGDDTPAARKGRRNTSPVASKQKPVANKNARDGTPAEKGRRVADRAKAVTDAKKGAGDGRGRGEQGKGKGGDRSGEVVRGRKRLVKIASGSDYDSPSMDTQQPKKRGRGRPKSNPEMASISADSDSDNSDVDSDNNQSDSSEDFESFSAWSVVNSGHNPVCTAAATVTNNDNNTCSRCSSLPYRPLLAPRTVSTPVLPAVSAQTIARHDAIVASRERHLVGLRRVSLKRLLGQWRQQVEAARKAALRALVQAQLSEERALARGQQLQKLHELLQIREQYSQQQEEVMEEQEHSDEEQEHHQELQDTLQQQDNGQEEAATCVSDGETTGDDTSRRSRTRPRKPGHKPWLESYRRRMEAPVASPSRGRGRGAGSGGRGRGKRGRKSRGGGARHDSESENTTVASAGDLWLNRRSSAEDDEIEPVLETKSRKRKSSTLALDSSLQSPGESASLAQQHSSRRKTSESAVNSFKRKAGGARSSPLTDRQNIERAEYGGDAGSRWLNSSVGSVNETHTSDEEDVQKENGKPVIMVLPPVLPQYDGSVQWRALDLDTRWGTVRVNVVPKRRERDGSLRELPKTVRKRVGLSVTQHLLQPVQVSPGMVKYVRVTPAFSLLTSTAPPAISSPPKPPPPSRVISVGRRHLIRDTSGKSILATFVPSGGGGDSSPAAASALSQSTALPFSRPVVGRSSLPAFPGLRTASPRVSATTSTPPVRAVPSSGRLLTVKRPSSGRVVTVTGARPSQQPVQSQPARVQPSIFDPADVAKVAGHSHSDQLPQLGSLEDELQLPAESTSDKPQQNSDLDMLALICASESKHAPSDQPPHETSGQPTAVQQASEDSTGATSGSQETAVVDATPADDATLTGTVDEHGHVRIVLADGTTVVADLGDISAFEAPGSNLGLTGE